MIPGTSRSGSTIVVGLLCGLSRTGAAAFSFLLALPTMFDKTACSSLVYGVVFPTPTKKSKGILVCTTTHGNTFIVPIVVKTVDLCCESSFFEGCCKMWNKLSLFVPWHEKAGAVALVEGLVLWSNGMDVNPLLSKCLYKLYEILCICASHIGVEMSACPGVVLLQRPQILYFHPFRACPWRGNDLDIWVDVQDFFDDGDDVVGFIIV